MGTRIAEPSTGAQASGRISFEQFLVDYDGEHVEWVDGEVLPMSPVSNRHVRIHFFLLSLLGRYNEVHSAGEILFEPFCMKIGPDLPARSPDILFVANEHADRVKKTHLEGPADLVVEIVSPDSRKRDRGEKYYEYEKGGVPEYWLIDPIREAAEFYRLDVAGTYTAVPPDDTGYYHSAVLDGLRLQPAWLWQDPLPPIPSLLRDAGVVGD